MSEPVSRQPAATPHTGVRLAEARGKWVLLATVLSSGMAMLDGTVVNVVLPELGRDLGASMADLQWVVNAYTLTLAGFILLGGSLGDRYGRRKVFLIGVVWFALASALCGLAPNAPTLIAARALQGIGGALLTPGSLSLIQASFVKDDRAKAVGAWSGLGGVAGAVGPFLGGGLADTIGWRSVFFLNIPLAAVVIWVTTKHVPESRDPKAHGRFDVLGAAVVALGLVALTYLLTEAPAGTASPVVLVIAGVVGVGSMLAFVLVERRRSAGHGPDPLVPLQLFANRQFTAINLVTLIVYAAMGVVMFLLVMHLQVVSGYGPTVAGSAMIPVTVLMLLLSAKAGDLASKIGPRRPITVGLLLAAAGLLLALRIGPQTSGWTGYLTDVLPAVLVFGMGLSAMVAPLTATVLASADDRHAGAASGVNNAVARTGNLLAVAAVPPAVGLVGDALNNPQEFDSGFSAAMIVSAAMIALGAVLTVLLVRDPDSVGTKRSKPLSRSHCAVNAPPLEPEPEPEPDRQQT
ncbi:MFS transporter [Nakamurella aerolata]|uniref:MFS transporter n=1 Tax=Nakamurella aerolata TaxID=1656892 RepID=A0A849ACU2_9ACTN|nr:MFS transporter [Nakamurella aerolata]NNG37553.1 MFS transporter [Nakamurella aerolata]